MAGGNPGTPYALSQPACITSRCPYKLTYFPGYSLIAIQENSWVGYPGISLLLALNHYESGYHNPTLVVVQPYPGDFFSVIAVIGYGESTT